MGEQKIALWDPQSNPEGTTDPFRTLFVSRINFYTSESKLRREFESYGPIKQIKMMGDQKTGKPRGYCFIEFEQEKDMHSAYKHADGKKIDGRRVLVDVERARTVKGWLPRRLGGGLGGTRRGGPDVNIRHSGREEGRDRDRGGGGRDAERRRSRSRDRDRERRRRRSRSRSKERTKKRSRSRESKRRSRSREGRKKRSRSRDRKRSRRSRSRELKQEKGEDGWSRVKIKDEPDDGMGYEGYPQDDNERYNIKQERPDDEDRKPFNDNGGYDDDGY